MRRFDPSLPPTRSTLVARLVAIKTTKEQQIGLQNRYFKPYIYIIIIIIIMRVMVNVLHICQMASPNPPILPLSLLSQHEKDHKISFVFDITSIWILWCILEYDMCFWKSCLIFSNSFVNFSNDRDEQCHLRKITLRDTNNKKLILNNRTMS